ncbi:MAG: hypothetical protein OEN23_05400 [Paracoccaceae bacterium]|nr:hypothetical protein [Paracoccaceae bacterium]
MTGAATARELTRPQKAAVVIGVLGPDAAGPVLEQFDEACLRSFTQAMTSLGRIDPVRIRAVIAEFLGALQAQSNGLSGGLAQARGLLESHVAEGVLAQILEDAAPTSPGNVWTRLAEVDDEALAGFLGGEHPQTAAVVLARFDPEQAARIVNALPADAARDIVSGLARAGNLDGRVVDAIAEAMGRDVLAKLSRSGQASDPADRAGAIMNFASPAIRDRILGEIEGAAPDLAAQIRRKMFTVEDVPARVPKNGVAAVVRSLDQQILLPLIASLREAAPETADFLLSNISSRIASQMEEDLAELKSVKPKDAEAAQTALIRVIRDLAAKGEIELAEPEEPGDSAS